MNATPVRPSVERRFLAGFLFPTVLAGLLEAASLIVLRRGLAPGEFGTASAILGVAAVAVAPLSAFVLASSQGILTKEEEAGWQLQIPGVMRLAAVGWGVLLLVFLFALAPFLSLPRPSLQILMMLTAEALLAVRLSQTLNRTANRKGLAVGLLLAGAALLLATSLLSVRFFPWAEGAVAAFLLAAITTGWPAIRAYSLPARREGLAWARQLRVPLAATASALLAVGLFTNAHCIAAQPNLGVAGPDSLGYVDRDRFDDFQVAGLLARGVLLAPLPLLFLFRTHRGGFPNTTRASLRWFWIYLGALVSGVVLLVVAAPLANVIFGGNPGAFLPTFAAPVVLLGLLQGITFYTVAARRWSECFVLGGLSLAYTVFLFYGGSQPVLMTTCMFGGALISLTVILLFGAVRYARTHP
jgi:hypothetical protein